MGDTGNKANAGADGGDLLDACTDEELLTVLADVISRNEAVAMGLDALHQLEPEKSPGGAGPVDVVGRVRADWEHVNGGSSEAEEEEQEARFAERSSYEVRIARATEAYGTAREDVIPVIRRITEQTRRMLNEESTAYASPLVAAGGEIAPLLYPENGDFPIEAYSLPLRAAWEGMAAIARAAGGERHVPGGEDPLYAHMANAMAVFSDYGVLPTREWCVSDHASITNLACTAEIRRRADGGAAWLDGSGIEPDDFRWFDNLDVYDLAEAQHDIGNDYLGRMIQRAYDYDGTHRIFEGSDGGVEIDTFTAGRWMARCSVARQFVYAGERFQGLWDEGMGERERRRELVRWILVETRLLELDGDGGGSPAAGQ